MENARGTQPQRAGKRTGCELRPTDMLTRPLRVEAKGGGAEPGTLTKEEARRASTRILKCVASLFFREAPLGPGERTLHAHAWSQICKVDNVHRW